MRRLTLTLLFFSAWIVAVGQQADSSLSPMDALNLNEVVVSGTRYEHDRSQSPIIVDVVKPKLLNASQSVALSEGLAFVPGVRVETNCQNCGFTQVRLNGLQGAYSQILINNRPIFSALNSVYGLDQIPANIIERIEVVRSGGSALYGSNAIGGTINVITKEPNVESWEFNSATRLVAGTALDQSTSFNTSQVTEEGISGATFYGMNRIREAYDANGDGFTELVKLNQTVVGTKAFFKTSEQSKLGIDLSAVQEYRRGGDQLDLAPHFTDITEALNHRTFFAGATLDFWTRSKGTSGSAYVSLQQTQRDSYYGGLGGGRTAADSALAINAYGNTFDLSAVSGSQLVTILSPFSTLTYGLEHQFYRTDDVIAGYNRRVDQQVHVIGSFAQLEWKPSPKLTALFGGRFDYTLVDGYYNIGTIDRNTDIQLGVFSPRATIMFKPNASLRLRGGYARGFRAPQAFNEDLHISSVGGEASFTILSEGLTKETSDAWTFSLNRSKQVQGIQTNVVIEGFYTQLHNPLTQVSTGATLPNGSIVEEIRNGSGAVVYGINFEGGFAPNPGFTLQFGGTLQRTAYAESQVLFEPEGVPEPGESTVSVNSFTRTPNLYGYLSSYYAFTPKFNVDLTGTYTGSMVVPHVVSTTGYLDLVETNSFLDINFKGSYEIIHNESFDAKLSLGVKNILNSFQNDFDSGASRDSDYIYGPAAPRTFFVSIRIGNLH